MRPKRIQSVDVDWRLVEEVRDAVVYLAGTADRTTITGLVRHAIRRELGRLRRKHLDGEPFPPRRHDPPAGRPVSVDAPDAGS